MKTFVFVLMMFIAGPSYAQMGCGLNPLEIGTMKQQLYENCIKLEQLEEQIKQQQQTQQQQWEQQRQIARQKRKVEQQDKQEQQEQPLSWQQRQDARAKRIVEQQKHETQESRQCGSDPMRKEGHREQVAYKTCMEIIENLKREGKDSSHVTRPILPVQSEGVVGRILYFGVSQEELIALDPFEDK